MTPVEALNIALKKEEASIKLYTKLSIEHSVIKDLLQLLINEEEKHKKLIQEKLVEVTKY